MCACATSATSTCSARRPGSPVYEYQARTRKVVSAAGTEWTDFYTGKTYTGGQQIEAAAPLHACRCS